MSESKDSDVVVERRPIPVGRGELFLTVFVTGAAVMLIEILGTRVIAPVFGAGLFVWSALLSVTLGALAVGYYAGGVLVDRTGGPRLLGLVVLASGVALAWVPASSSAVLEATLDLGSRGGPLAAAVLLFAPCLSTLGMVGPVAVRLMTTELKATGHRVGSVYAVSTVGSLFGTLLTVFVLVPNLDTDRIFFITSSILVGTGAGALALRRSPLALLAVGVPLLAGVIPEPPYPEGFKLLDESESLYGRVQVVDDLERGVRFLRVDHSVIGAEFIDGGSAAFGFLHLLEAIQFLRPAAKDMLLIGLGSGTLVGALDRRLQVDAVEIDPVVVRFARQHFGFEPRRDIFIEDARTLLQRSDRAYDLIVHDTFTGGSSPDHLLSIEILRRIHALLRPNGVLALNFVGYRTGPKAAASWAVLRTVRAVFGTARAFGDRPISKAPESAINLVLFASDAPLDFEIPAAASFETESCEQILRSFQTWEVLEQIPEGPLVTDSHNPLARLQLPVAEDHFEAMNKLLPRAIWLH